MKIEYVGLKSAAPTPCTPLDAAYTITVSVKPPSTAIRTQAPIHRIHLPMPNDRIAAYPANQMKPSGNRYFQAPVRSKKKSLNTVTARSDTGPPSKSGID